MYTKQDDTTNAVGAVLLAAVMVVSMVAMGGVAAQPASTQSVQPAVDDGPELASHAIPAAGDLASDEFRVDDDYEPGEVADNDLLYPNITAAMDNAGDGYTIYVAEGTYDESVTVDKQVDLIGAGPDAVEVTGNSVVLTITADSTTVHGFTLVGDDGDNVVEVLATSPSHDVKNLEFTDNRVIVGDDAKGLYQEPMEQDTPSHTETLIQGNEFTVRDPDTSPSNPATAVNFVHIDATTEAIPHHVTIDDNRFYTPTHKGEHVGQMRKSVVLQANHSQVTNNRLDARANPDTFESAQIWVGSQGEGVVTEGNLVDGNHVEANWAWYGIVANYDGGTDLTVSNNMVTESQEAGVIVARYDGAVIEGNNVHSNHGPGIWVFASENVEVLSNNVDSNQRIGVYMNQVEEALIHENVITNTMGSNGLLLDQVWNVQATYNTLQNNGVGANVTGSDTANVELRKNEFIDNAEVGVHVHDFDESVPEDARPVVNYNDFSAQDHDVENDVEVPIDARLNWFGVHDHTIADEASVEGMVIYDPFLTEAPWDIEQEKHKTEAFAHDFTVQESTGPVHAVGFPGPVDRTVGEVFADLPNSSGLYMYDADAGQWVTPNSGDSIDPLDAFVITDLPEGETVTLVAGYEGDGAAAPQNADLAEGWNLVGAPKKGHSEDTIVDRSSATMTVVQHSYQQPASQPTFLDGTSARGDEKNWDHTVGTGDDKCVSPYAGYWAFVDDSDTGSLPAALTAGTTYQGEIDQLETDEKCK
ncbi:hypothetical protein GCM10027435_12780 [Haloparvum alkalitolerans]|uniref:right-handed parallel beta-helix repeat-containing protein n=1 Tax=Haloparvum alkalitolerans TaxID=1042953 RepID=UPI003CE94DD4